MKLTLTRVQDNGKSTLGEIEVDDFKCYSLEDTYHEQKVYSQTCIPVGEYEIKLRTEGKFHNKYAKEFKFHKGMLWLQDVPGYRYILIHIGNTVEDTAGCILVGTNVVNDDFISESTRAYIKLYNTVLCAFERGEKVTIEIKYKDESVKDLKK